ncbi:GlsB/YeaQ/YmgE family stress response membrane protein [Actinomadura madurae]|nr:GlsB/YeaQ/YmgE family stress response membrane protein [Actinomadura madurae]MCP9977129.1 GlsB/YeaQ/YmgE family stress response membrane protein [Actinomadura madurae]MCQ0011357.1 GlsB/YeaQ/YmgE family stress response membrane protein [Actinomadura madurae]URM93551.1 GlsB/YeaQ/YmgE family stress response membrane protein [Actinomadura madurae]
MKGRYGGSKGSADDHRGLAAAVVVGAAIGALGRLVVPGRPGMPAWLLMAAGVVAAFAGTGLANLTGLTEGGWSLWEAFLQIALAAVGVSLVAIVWPERTHHP